jgi:hypothetical protein
MKNQCSLQSLIGKKIVTIRGERGTDYYGRTNRRKYGFEPVYVLFSDKETVVRLGTQDENYHDCARSARHINLDKSKLEWERIFKDSFNYPVADLNI